MSGPSPINSLYCLLNLACVHVCVHVWGGRGTHPGRCCSSWRWSLVGVGPAGWNDIRTSTEWYFSPACWLSPFQPCFLKAGSEVRGGTRRGIRQKELPHWREQPGTLILHTWLSIFNSCSVVLCCSDSIRARIPVPVMKLDSTFRLFRVVFTFSISARAWKSTKLLQPLMTSQPFLVFAASNDTEEWKTQANL